MYERILHAFLTTPLAITAEKLGEIREFLALKAQGGRVADDVIERLREQRAERELRTLVAIEGAGLELQAAANHRGAILRGKTAVVPIFGVLAQRVSGIESASGGVGAEQIGATLDSLMNDREVRSIVLAIDSPGGSVFGIPELADKIRGYAGEKKIIALADSVAASAAYWIGSQATELVVTPGGQVGSIGVLVAHEDTSARDQAKGRKTTVISSSPYKAEGSPFEPLSEEARAELQSKVDHYHGLFVKAVARGRQATEHRVETAFGQGRMVTAQDAVDRGMADRVATLEQVLRRLGAGEASAGTMTAAKVPDRITAQLRLRELEAQQ